MLGDNKDDDERFWNFMLFKIPMTNKEIDEIPWPLVIVAVLGICTLIGWAIIKSL